MARWCLWSRPLRTYSWRVSGWRWHCYWLHKLRSTFATIIQMPQKRRHCIFDWGNEWKSSQVVRKTCWSTKSETQSGWSVWRWSWKSGQPIATGERRTRKKSFRKSGFWIFCKPVCTLQVQPAFLQDDQQTAVQLKMNPVEMRRKARSLSSRAPTRVSALQE